MQQLEGLLLTSVSTCFGHHYAHLQENKEPVTAFGVSFSNKRENVDISRDVFFVCVRANVVCTHTHTRHSHAHTKSQPGLPHSTPQKRRHG